MKGAGKYREVDVYKYLISTLETMVEQHVPDATWQKYMRIKRTIQQKSGIKLDISKPKKTEAETEVFKQSIEVKDLFTRPHPEPGQTRTYQTIFLDPLACLKYCSEQVEKLIALKKSQWEDPEFGPTPEDKSGIDSLYFAINKKLDSMPDPSAIEWAFPEDIVQRQYMRFSQEQYRNKNSVSFTIDGSTSSDVRQGLVPDCWLISSLAIVATREEWYISGRLTNKQINQYSGQNFQLFYEGARPSLFHWLEKWGMYVIKIFKWDKPIFVVIDKKLPVFKDRLELAFGKCADLRELWLPLIEKAFAKLHGSYSILDAGEISQGIRDINNFMPLKYKIPKFSSGKKGKASAKVIAEKDAFWAMIKQLLEGGSLIGCNVEGGSEAEVGSKKRSYEKPEATGLLSGHAYSLIGYIQIPKEGCEEKNSRLVVVRNPWGRGEWCQKWSESKAYIQKLRKAMPKIEQFYRVKREEAKSRGQESPEEYQLKEGKGADDGLFLICYKDFRTYFSNLFIAYNMPAAQWSTWLINDELPAGKSAGGFAQGPQFFKDQPQYKIEITKQTQVMLVIQQYDGRIYNQEEFPFKKFSSTFYLVVVKGEGRVPCFIKEDQVGLSTMVCNRRESSTQVLTLEPGSYVAVVATGEVGEYAKYCIYVKIKGGAGKVTAIAPSTASVVEQKKQPLSRESIIAAKYAIRKSKEVFGA